MSPNQQFAEWLDSMPRFKQTCIINEISCACDVKYQTVYKWRMNKAKIKTPYIDIINKVAGEQVIKS